MKGFIALISFCITFLPSFVTCQSIYFNSLIDLQDEAAAGLSVLSGNPGYIIAASTYTTQNNIGIIFLDSLGSLIEAKTYTEPGFGLYPGGSGSLKKDGDMYILAGGKTDGVDDYGYFLKLDHQGDSIFSRTYENPTKSLLFYDSGLTNDGGYIMTGGYYVGGNDVDVVLLKTDSLGNEEFMIHYGWGSLDQGYSVFQSPDSGYVVGGYSYTPGIDNSGEPLILKFDKNGNYQWYRKPGGWYDDKQAMVARYDDTSFVAFTMLSDSAISMYSEYSRIRVMKYGYNSAYVSEIFWDRTYGKSKRENSVGNIQVLEDGDIICCGTKSAAIGEVYRGGWMLRLSGEGDSIWYRDYYYYDHSMGNNKLYDLSPAYDNGFVACGRALATPPYELKKVWILKTDSLGCDTAGCDPTVGIIDQALPEWDHLTFFPNPATGRVFVKLPTIPDKSKNQRLELLVYDVFGRLVDYRVVRQDQESIILHLEGTSPGLNIGLLRMNGRTIAKGKFVVVPG